MLSKGDEATWNTMLQRYMDETNAQEKTKLLKGLAWINQPWMIRQFLRLVIILLHFVRDYILT